MLKRLLPLILLLVALTPALTTRAAVPSHVVYDKLTFTGNSGNTGCTGPIVGVYGSSALKSYVLATAASYCAAQLGAGVSSGNAVDVEYLSGGDSCPGVDFAADDRRDPIIGVSDVFASGCVGIQARAAAKSGTQLRRSMWSRRSPFAARRSPLRRGRSVQLEPCAMQGRCPRGAHGKCARPLPAATFPFPNDHPLAASYHLWNPIDPSAIGDLGQVGGCAGIAPAIQVRLPGSGTRVTWCYNIYGAGLDDCSNSAAAAAQGGSGGLVAAICGNPYSQPPAGPLDAMGTIGHTSRATVVIDPNVLPVPGSLDNLETKAPIIGCGIVSLAGHSGYNRDCDPIKALAGVQQASRYIATDTNGDLICKGDREVATGAYQVWGYEHFDTSAKLTSGPSYRYLYAAAGIASLPVGGDLTYLLHNTTQQNRLRGFGFMDSCQMQVARSRDASPYRLNLGYSC